MGKDHILLYSDCSPTWSKEPPQNSSWPPLLWPDQQLNPHSSSCVFAQTTRTFQLWILFHLFYKNKKTNKETRWAKEGCVGGSLYIRNPNWAISNLWGLALLFFLFFFSFVFQDKLFQTLFCYFSVMCYIQTFSCMDVCFSRSPPVIFPFFLPLSPAHQSPSFLIHFPFHFPVLYTYDSRYLLKLGLTNQRKHDYLFFRDWLHYYSKAFYELLTMELMTMKWASRSILRSNIRYWK